MRKLPFVLGLVALCAGLAASKPAKAPKAPPIDPLAPTTFARLHVSQAGAPLGVIDLHFFAGETPRHVEHFVAMALQDAYDGTLFHRVIPGFLIQGGDPRSKAPDRSEHGKGYFADKKGKPIFLRAELGSRRHTRGMVGMSRGIDLHSASSQFYICLVDSPHLDNKYTIFAEVVAGLEIVDRIAATPRDAADHPITDVVVTDVEILSRPAVSPA